MLTAEAARALLEQPASADLAQVARQRLIDEGDRADAGDARRADRRLRARPGAGPC